MAEFEVEFTLEGKIKVTTNNTNPKDWEIKKIVKEELQKQGYELEGLEFKIGDILPIIDIEKLNKTELEITKKDEKELEDLYEEVLDVTGDKFQYGKFSTDHLRSYGFSAQEGYGRVTFNNYEHDDETYIVHIVPTKYENDIYKFKIYEAQKDGWSWDAPDKRGKKLGEIYSTIHNATDPIAKTIYDM